MMLRPTLAAALAFLAVSSGGARAETAVPEACRPVQAQGDSFTVCTVDLRRQRVRLFWLGADGQPYSSLSALAEKQGPRLSFAMNAGMYDKGQAPVGLYVEDGRGWFRSKTKNRMARFAGLAGEIARSLNVRDAVFDGEIVVMGESGPDFDALFSASGTGLRRKKRARKPASSGASGCGS